MKPIYLKMTAFASYNGTAEVDFTQLYENGIFLITGKTGGGKTTILDAICTALYGRATGSVRGKEWRQFRSINAPDSRDTEIEYIFSVAGIKYKFYRRWHMPNSKKEDRKLDDKENACYRRTSDSDDWEIIATGSAKAVEQAAAGIIKLTHEQFVKLIMLPQGEFRELLVSDDERKTDIFKKLFDTERWETITDAIKDEAKNISDRCREQRGMRQFALDSAACESPDELDEKIKEISGLLSELAIKVGQNETETRRTAEALQKGETLAKLFKELDIQQAELKRLEADTARYSELRQKLAQSRRLRGALSEYSMMNAADLEASRASASVKKAADDKAKADRALNAAKENYAHLPELEKNRDSLNAVIAGLTELAKSRAAHTQAAADLKRHSDDLKAHQDTLTALENEKKTIEDNIRKGNEYLVKCMEASKALPAAAEKCADLQNALTIAKEHEEKAAHLSDLERNLSNADVQLKQKEAELLSQQKSVEAMEHAIRCDKAYSLASDLAEGVPCPVCGSTHHPSIAQPAASTPTAQQLEICKGLADKAAKELATLRAQHSALTAKQEMLTRDIAAIAQKADGAEIRSSRVLQAEFEAAKAERDRLKKLADNVIPSQKKIEYYSHHLNDKSADIRNAETHINNLTLQISSDRQTLTSLDERLQSHGIAGFDELDSRLRQANARFNRTQAEIKSLTDIFHQSKNAADSSAALLASAQESLVRANSACRTRRAEFAAKCAQLGLPEESDFKGGILDDRSEGNIDLTLKEYEEKLAFARKRIGELSGETEGMSRPDTAALENAHRQTLEEGRTLSRQKGELESKLKSLDNCRRTVTETDIALKTLEQQYSTAQRMSHLLSNKNIAKMSIHRYVIGLKMDHVITQANEYLKKLTRGQYSMRRIAGGADKINHALDIEILDACTGGVRAVSTLSGGELFLASLSLAFGLSETVQSFAGGIHLDSLFIDEGFGSLDSETLDTAMEAITRVRENRLLGIISHVSELQERIPCGIEVIKNRDGSSLRIR